MSDVFTIDVLDMSLAELQCEVISLHSRNVRLIALLRLIITVMKVIHFTLSQIRHPQAAQKLRVLQAIEYSRKYFPLKTVLRVIGLSHGRYREWKLVWMTCHRALDRLRISSLSHTHCRINENDLGNGHI
ncbi:hypothetical protein F1728_04775 [Gimesia benthica]|uniref:Uncharacterized protein n=1 Tax=Gimesia benthica TaxID=2608982 RepID=A0A6I6A6R2_9PLAN|nr:hypothetical protein [Gimesia benthica]QGQ22047.1 hypothetical protein F1728_04775 [Gimesia benthica]